MRSVQKARHAAPSIPRRFGSKKRPHERARAEILEGRGRHFDPDVVDAFVALDEEFMTIARTYVE